MENIPDRDGSEAHVFRDDGDKVYKTIVFTHFREFDEMMDRISIHNATFPHAALTVEGFGVRDDFDDSDGFAVVVSQPKVQGTTPTPEFIEQEMEKRGYEKSENGAFFVSKMDNTVLMDVNEKNAVRSPEGRLLVFDCDAYLKTFCTNTRRPQVTDITNLLPRNGGYDDSAWRAILGDEGAALTAQRKSEILKELRRNGRVGKLIDGKGIIMQNETPDADTGIFTGNIIVSDVRDMHKEHTWEIPALAYNEQSVEAIRKEICSLMPASIPLDEFLYDERWVGPEVASIRGGGPRRTELKTELARNGRLSGPVNGKYVVQKDPENPENVLISDRHRIAFMLHSSILGLNAEERDALSMGRPIEKDGARLYFNLDRGRVDPLPSQRKLTMKQKQKNQLNPTEQKTKTRKTQRTA